MESLITLEARFLEHLATIDRISMALCRRRGILGADADDFSAIVRARFVESGYAPLVQFRGDSSIATYFTVVIASWLNDHIVARDGRWRPSAAAQRLGPVAVLLERLISKRGVPMNEAVATVLSGADHPYSEHELRAMVRALPIREPMRPIAVSSDAAGEFTASRSVGADAGIESDEEQMLANRTRSALESAMDQLDVEDRAIVAMRFLGGQSVADIARALRLDQKPLYRRLERCLGELRRLLESGGVSVGDVQVLVDRGSHDAT